MNRSTAVSISAVLVLLGSAFAALTGVLEIAVAFFFPGPEATQPLLRPIMYFGAVVMFAFAGWGIATGIGLFRLRRWARLSLLTFSGILLFFGVIGIVIASLILIPRQPGESDQALHAVRVAASAFYLLLIAFGAWWLWLFNTRGVKQQFLGEGAAAGVRSKPFSIVVIGWFLLLAGCVLLPFSLLHFPAMVLGWVLTGAGAHLLYFGSGVAEIYLGYALLKFKPLGRTLSIYFFAYCLLNSAVSLLLPGRQERMVAAMKAFSATFQMPAPPPQMPPAWLSLAIVVVIMGVPLWIVVRRKDAFLPSANPPAPNP